MIPKQIYQTLLILVVLFSCLRPVDAAWPLLSEKDTQKFIQTFPGIYKEYRRMGLKVNPETGKIVGEEKLKHDQEVNRILKENGWNFMFWPKLQVIVRGYSLTKQDEFTGNHGANIEKFVSDLTSAKWMTPEKRAELETFYANLKTNAASTAALKRSQVHQEDLNLIRASMARLDTVMAEIAEFEWNEANGNRGHPGPNNNISSSHSTLTLPPLDQEFTDSKHRDALIQIMDSVNSPRSLARKVIVLREGGGRVAWSPKGDRILIDQKGPDGYYDLYLIRPDGTDEQCLSCDTGGVLSKGHKGTAEWHPSGDYIVFQSQKRQDTGNWGKDIAATPGFGRYMDVWLMDVRSKKFFQITQTANTDDTGVLHPHFSQDGSKLTWSEMYSKPNGFNKTKQMGFWKLKVADFSLVNGRPQVSNEKAYEPGGQGFYENHGLSRDNRKLLFTAKLATESSTRKFVANIYQYDITTNKLDKLTSQKYNEHAHYYPRKNRILWMTSAGNPTRGTDFWNMNPDGSDKTRITDFNNPNNPSFARKMIVAADSSFNPDGTKLVAYLQLNLITQEGPIVLIDL